MNGLTNNKIALILAVGTMVVFMLAGEAFAARPRSRKAPTVFRDGARIVATSPRLEMGDGHHGSRRGWDYSDWSGRDRHSRQGVLSRLGGHSRRGVLPRRGRHSRSRLQNRSRGCEGRGLFGLQGGVIGIGRPQRGWSSGGFGIIIVIR